MAQNLQLIESKRFILFRHEETGIPGENARRSAER